MNESKIGRLSIYCAPLPYFAPFALDLQCTEADWDLDEKAVDTKAKDLEVVITGVAIVHFIARSCDGFS